MPADAFVRHLEKRIRVQLDGPRVLRVELLRSPLKRPAKVSGQFVQYLKGRRRRFTLQPALQGTPFQVRVWKALLRIPYGRTVTYSQLACLAGFPGAARAVGQAMRRNPVPLLVPCHRVVAAGGRLGGFSCGLEWKRFLLRLEGSFRLDGAGMRRTSRRGMAFLRQSSRRVCGRARGRLAKGSDRQSRVFQ